MSGYIPEIHYQTSYEDDEVTFVLKPLSKGNFLKVMPLLLSAKESADTAKVYSAACDVLADSITSMNGLKDKNGNAINASTFLEEIYFIDLVTEVFQKLILEASLGKSKVTDLGAKLQGFSEEQLPKTSS